MTSTQVFMNAGMDDGDSHDGSEAKVDGVHVHRRAVQARRSTIAPADECGDQGTRHNLVNIIMNAAGGVMSEHCPITMKRHASIPESSSAHEFSAPPSHFS